MVLIINQMVFTWYSSKVVGMIILGLNASSQYSTVVLMKYGFKM
jgi:hypothetical protein